MYLDELLKAGFYRGWEPFSAVAGRDATRWLEIVRLVRMGAE